MMRGSIIGLPPVLNFGNEALKAKVVPDVLSGRKPICLAISEAFAGSDVAGLRTSAVKTEGGKSWVINRAFFLPLFDNLDCYPLFLSSLPSKKWITNGMSAH